VNRALLIWQLVQHFINPVVVAAIEQGVQEAATHGEWSNGEKTEFVEAKARAIAAASDNRYDDFLVEIGIKAYNATRKGKQ
jgi:hypothetical protein